MPNHIRPAENLLGKTLKGGWKVTEVYSPPLGSKNKFSSPCYKVQNGTQKGFLKAFDYSDLKKAGGKELHKRLSHKYERELSLLKKCQEKNIKSVIRLLTSDQIYLVPEDLDQLVEYFILEYSDDGNIIDCLNNGNLNDFKNRFQALIYIFDGLHELHSNGIMHLDLKAENLVHFVNERLTKITDFGSARQLINGIDEDLLEELNSINTTRQYAPPECLYGDTWTTDWNLYRRKIDLYLVGNIIVKLFTNFSFTALLKKELSSILDWNDMQNVGKNKLKQYLPHLITGAAEVYVIIENRLREINNELGSVLSTKDICDVMKIISELCNPDAEQRGHPKEFPRNNNSDGLDRYRDKFITVRDICLIKSIKQKN